MNNGGVGEADDVSDDLYRAPLGEFIAVRDALAARLKGAGDKAGAAEVKGARKPSVPAWAANQVVWQAPEEWERLRTAVRGLRKAHVNAVSSEELRRAVREQREALHECEARASELLARHGHAASPAVVQKVGHTLLSLAHGTPGVTPGRLDHELPPPGFEAFSGLSLAAVPKPRAGRPRAESEAAPESESEPEAERASPAAPSLARATPPAADSARATAEQKAREQRAARAEAVRLTAEARQAEGRRAVLRARARLAADEERRSALEEQLEEARRACDETRRQLEAAEAEARSAEAALLALRAEPAGE
jgi:hypothetical protein